jgi:hypothetical protein
VLSLSRKILVCWLVLLQFFAPLVHAHTGKQLTGNGLHLPGLEIYDHLPVEAVLSATHFDYDGDGLTVGVNSGIQQQSEFLPIHFESNNYAIISHQILPIANLTDQLLKVNFSPQYKFYKKLLFSSSYSPRAPPPLFIAFHFLK